MRVGLRRSGVSLRKRIAAIGERLDALEAEPDEPEAPEWKPLKWRDHSGEAVDAQGIWRESVAEYAHGWWGDEDWSPWGYL